MNLIGSRSVNFFVEIVIISVKRNFTKINNKLLDFLFSVLFYARKPEMKYCPGHHYKLDIYMNLVN